MWLVITLLDVVVLEDSVRQHLHKLGVDKDFSNRKQED